MFGSRMNKLQNSILAMVVIFTAQASFAEATVPDKKAEVKTEMNSVDDLKKLDDAVPVEAVQKDDQKDNAKKTKGPKKAAKAAKNLKGERAEKAEKAEKPSLQVDPACEQDMKTYCTDPNASASAKQDCISAHQGVFSQACQQAQRKKGNSGKGK